MKQLAFLLLAMTLAASCTPPLETRELELEYNIVNVSNQYEATHYIQIIYKGTEYRLPYAREVHHNEMVTWAIGSASEQDPYLYPGPISFEYLHPDTERLWTQRALLVNVTGYGKIHEIIHNGLGLVVWRTGGAPNQVLAACMQNAHHEPAHFQWTGQPRSPVAIFDEGYVRSCVLRSHDCLTHDCYFRKIGCHLNRDCWNAFSRLHPPYSSRVPNPSKACAAMGALANSPHKIEAENDCLTSYAARSGRMEICSKIGPKESAAHCKEKVLEGAKPYASPVARESPEV